MTAAAWQVDLARVALLVIDMQNDFVRPGAVLEVPGIRETIPRIRQLIDACRSLSIPVIYTALVHSATLPLSPLSFAHDRRIRDGALCEDGDGAAIVADLAPRPGEIVITKRRHSAFYGTDLEIVLRNVRGPGVISTMIVCGTTTNVCVEGTVRDAFYRDYQVVVVSDACSAFEPSQHDASLANVRYILGRVATTQEVLAELGREPS